MTKRVFIKELVRESIGMMNREIHATEGENRNELFFQLKDIARIVYMINFLNRGVDYATRKQPKDYMKIVREYRKILTGEEKQLFEVMLQTHGKSIMASCLPMSNREGMKIARAFFKMTGQDRKILNRILEII